MTEALVSLRDQLAEVELSLRLIQEQKSKYVQEIDVPLQMIKDERRLETQRAHLQKRLAQLTTIACPYRGLEPFEAEHIAYYFGRTRMVERLVDKIKNGNFVMVVGPSGCGKSSLVRAGLVAALRQGALPGSRDWAIRFFRPGTDPLRAFAASLYDLLDPAATEVTRLLEARRLADHLRDNALPLADVIARLHDKHPTFSRVVLVVDQCEELYTESISEPARQAFVETLLKAAAQGLVIILTLRADFYGYALADRQLGPATDASLVNVLAMSQDELRESIEKPTLQTGRRFEAGLVDRILAEVAEQPGNLPLLEFALTELWQHQTAEELLTHASYEEIGRVAGAVTQRAEAIYEQLKAQGQHDVAQHIFVQLIHYGEGATSTRRRMAIAELSSHRVPSAAVEQVVKVLSDARLLVTGHEEATRTATVEIAHEAIIQHWTRLHHWLENDQAFGLWRERLAVARQMWKQVKCEDGALLRGSLLSEAKSWLDRRADDLNSAECEYIRASLELQEREAARRQIDLENERRLAELQTLRGNLEQLSKALVGSGEMQALVDQVVNTIAKVLGASASSLYLVNQESDRLIIRAATGYQTSLVAAGASYRLGEGVTGWVAQAGQVVRANSLQELHQHPAWTGKQNKIQHGHEPSSFLALPLKVEDRFAGRERVIGVLKIEDISPSPMHPEAFFTDQDVVLISMMANVIAVVVYNTQVAATQLQSFSENVAELSRALAGGHETRILVSNVMHTLAKILRVEASSLYLIDETTGKLVIQAATGYQTPLVEAQATYELGEGVTGWIAQYGMPFRSHSVEELHRHPAWRGKQNLNQASREPRSFLGLPLKIMERSTGQERVIGLLKLEDIVPSPDHPEPYFTEQDVVLVSMMANIIALSIGTATAKPGEDE